MFTFRVTAILNKRNEPYCLALILSLGLAFSLYGSETSELRWKRTSADCTPQIRSHQRVFQVDGTQVERISVLAKTGTHCFVSTPIDAACVIHDFAASVNLRSNRQGLQLLARVVFPSTSDANGDPLSVMVRGQAYTDNGSWQTLSLRNLPKKVQRAKRHLRLKHSSTLDLTESYIDQLVINIYGGPGLTTTEIGTVEMTGIVCIDSLRLVRNQRKEIPVAKKKSVVVVQNGMIRVDGIPFFPRIIEHRGEPFELLAKLGFNSIALPGPPTPRQVHDADRLGLRLLCVDPPPSFLAAHPTPLIAARWTRRNEPKYAVDGKSQFLTVVDSPANLALRPIRLIGINATTTAKSTSEYFSKLTASRRELMRNSAGFWASVSTNTSPGDDPQAILSNVAWATRLRNQSLAAIAAGVRGLWYSSSSRLDAKDRLTALRRSGLERINLEHQILHPWSLAGRPDQVVLDAGLQRSNAILSLERAKLLIRFPNERPFLATFPSRQRQPSIQLTGLSNLRQSYEISATGMTPVKQLRVAGGIMVHPRTDQSHLLSTSDPMVLSQVKRRVASFRDRATQLELEVARIELELAQLLIRRTDVKSISAQQHLDSAMASLVEATSHYRSRDHRSVHLRLESTRKHVRALHELVSQTNEEKREGPFDSHEKPHSI